MSQAATALPHRNNTLKFRGRTYYPLLPSLVLLYELPTYKPFGSHNPFINDDAYSI